MTSPLFSGPSATRRTLFKSAGKATAVLAAAALTLSACSTGPASSAGDASASSSSSSQFPVTIEHVYGETTIEKQPTRVATVSWVNDDVAIALGVVPVGVPKNEWGGNEQGSTPWKDAALEELGAGFGSDKAPVQYSEADGINFTEIAKLTPDVILAAYSGLTEEDYKKLTGKSSNYPLLNRAIQGQAAPGSIFKVVSTAAAVQAGYDFDGRYNCSSSYSATRWTRASMLVTRLEPGCAASASASPMTRPRLSTS